MKSVRLSSFLPRRSAVLATLALATLTSSAFANALLPIVNGSFEQTLKPGSSEFGDRYASQQVTGWSTGGYNFVFAPGAADTTGGLNSGGGTVKLWGPGGGSGAGNYSANGLPATSPDGGNFLAMDGAFEQAPITQTLVGLIVGQKYDVSFWWAGAQQSGYSGVTTEQFKVGLGSSYLYTAVLTDPSHGFTGWQYTTLEFTATGTSQVLSFLAVGTPEGVPPFSLLDGVTVSQVTPEPSSLALLATGLFGAGGMIRRRIKKNVA